MGEEGLTPLPGLFWNLGYCVGPLLTLTVILPSPCLGMSLLYSVPSSSFFLILVSFCSLFASFFPLSIMKAIGFVIAGNTILAFNLHKM